MDFIEDKINEDINEDVNDDVNDEYLYELIFQYIKKKIENNLHDFHDFEFSEFKFNDLNICIKFAISKDCLKNNELIICCFVPDYERGNVKNIFCCVGKEYG